MVSYDNGKTYQYLTNNDGSKIEAIESAGKNSIFDKVEYDTTSKKLTIIYGSDKTIELQVIDTFYLKIKGMENTPIFPLNETRLYEVEQQDVTGAVIALQQEDKPGPSETDAKLVQVAASFLGRQMEE